MFDLLATVLSWCYELVPSYGVALILLTLAVMLVVTPLTLKGTRSMLELQVHQPELKRIQNQYRDDRQKMNEEMMKFYQEHKINPVGGCLPMLIQLPVFFVLYRVIRGLTERTSLLEALARYHDAGLAGTFKPRYLDHSSELFASLHQSRDMMSWGIDLSRSAVQAMGDGFGTALPYVVLILLVTAGSYYQQKQIQGRNPNAAANPQMQAITRIMPLFLTFISLSLPAALVVYFLVSGAYRIGQQAIITRHIYTDELKEKLAASRATSTVTTTAREGDAPKGFLGKLLGESAPQVGSAARGSDKAKDRADRGRGGDGASAAPPEPKASGRVTTPGTRSAASRKKKKRK